MIADMDVGISATEQPEHVYISHVDALYTRASFDMGRVGGGSAI